MKIVTKFLLLPVMLLLSVFGRAATFDQNSAVLTNPYMPWNVGAEFVFIGAGDAAGISLRYRCLAVESIGGVSCLMVETVDFGRANLRTRSWLAQDTDGNIWQLQQSDEQFDGSWETESGEGLYIPAALALGESFELFGLYPSLYTVVSLTGTASTPYQTFNSCVVIELSELDYVEQEFIAPGFGPVRVTFSGFENGSFELQSVSGFNPPTQQAPVLTITNLGDQMLVSWPNSLTNYALEWTTNLASGPWRTVSSDVFWVGNRSHFTNPFVPASRFFRLKQVNTNTQVMIDVASYANLQGRWDYRRTEAETGAITPWALSVLGVTTKNGQPVYFLQEYDEVGLANDQWFWHTNLSEGAFEIGGLNDYGQPTQEKWHWQPSAPTLMRSFVPGEEYTNSYTRTDMPGVAIEGSIKTEADTVSVPYGILDCCKVTRTFAIGGEVVHVERAWFASNLGLVKRDQEGGDLWELISYQPDIPSSTDEGYYEVYGNTDAEISSIDPSDFTLIGNSLSGNTFDVSAYGRFMILVPSSSERVLFDAFGLDSQWVDSAPGPERRHVVSNMEPTDGTWATKGDSCIEGPPDGVTMEGTSLGDSIYTFSTLAAKQLTVYTIP